MGWTAWHGMWEHKVYQRNLLKKAGARLTKPRLIQSYSLWKAGWNKAMDALSAMSQSEQIAMEASKRTTVEAELKKLRKELEDARKAMLEGRGQEAEMRRLAEEQIEKEKEKRVEALGKQGLKRMLNQKLSMGWSAWHGKWDEKRRQTNLLKKAGARLTKPHLIQSYSHWKRGWEAEMYAAANLTQEQRLKQAVEEAQAAAATNAKLRKELDEARQAMLDGRGQEAEMARLAQEELEKEKEKRVAHLGQLGVKRMLNQKLSMGWTAWHGMWEHKVYQRNLLKKAGARLTRPKLISSYQLWRISWEREMVVQATAGTSEQRLRRETLKLEDAQNELLRLRNEFDKKLKAASHEREALLEKLSSFDGGTAEREADLQKRLEEEKEKRVEHIKQMAAHRFGKQSILRGWTAWHALWSGRNENRRVLQQAAGRLTKPKLAQAYSLWNRDWQAARQAALAVEASFSSQQLEAVLKEKAAYEKEVVKLNREREELLNKLTKLDGGKAAAELEMERVREEEKEKRIAHLQRMAARRILAKDLGRGMAAWTDLWFQKTRNQRLLTAAAGRIARPKLAAGYQHWRRDFELEAAAAKQKASKAKYADDDARVKTMEREFYRQREELEEKNSMLSTSLDEMRQAASRKAEELARALRGAYEERAELDRLRKETEAALERERKAREDLAERHTKDAEAAARQLRKMLDEQRRQLESERQVIQNELLEEIEQLRAKLRSEQNRPKPVVVQEPSPPAMRKTAMVEYDPNRSVADLLKEALKVKNMRVMDLFRDFDADGSGEIDKKEWKKAWERIGPDFPASVVADAFDEFDKDKGGSLEFSEIEKHLRKPTGMGALSGAKKAAGLLGKLKAKGEVADDDLHGEGKGDFAGNMQIKADDFFDADKDGDTELEFPEFVQMIRKRDPDDSSSKMSDAELKKLFQQLDLDGSGTVDLAEYVQWALQQALRESKGRVLELFKSWDDDNSGFVDCNEFHQALNGMGFRCSKKDAKKVFSALDPDNSGKLDYKELNAALRKIQRRGYNMTSSTTADKKPGSKKPSPDKKPSPGLKKR